MNEWLNYIICYIGVWLQSIIIWQGCFCVLCVGVGYLTLCHGILRYINSKCANKFVNFREVIQATYLVYYAHIYIIMAVIYICYLFLIMGINLIYDIYLWVHHSPLLCGMIGPHLQLDYIHGGDHIKPINTNDMTTEINSMCFGEKGVENIVKGVAKTPNIPCSKICSKLGLANSMFTKPLNVVSLDVDMRKDSQLLEQEQFSQNKRLLHLFKQMYPEYKHIEVIFIDNPTYKKAGIPDAIFYDTIEDTYTTVQYKFSLGNNFSKFEWAKFPLKYNHTTHLMDIMLAHEKNFEQISKIMEQHMSQFDTGIHLQANLDDTNMDKIRLELEEINELDHKFMAKQGLQIKHDFYHQFYKQDYSKFKHDRAFTYALYQFEQTYGGNKNVYIPSNLSNLSNLSNH